MQQVIATAAKQGVWLLTDNENDVACALAPRLFVPQACR